ncbi:polyketide synthase [Sorangium sp. So ce1097]|uniref:polyketide synthase n=1 Tax=Sorangium sp. So ce1097 TaxID=3133330 RepID=UPI003F60F5E4
MKRTVRVERLQEGVIELRMDAPEEQNRLSELLCRELMAALSELKAEPALKVLLLSGGKDVFCGGATFNALQGVSSGPAAVLDLLLPDMMLAFPVPIVGALEGHAVGGGLALALCCDVLVAAETSRYGVNFTDLGFTPGMGTTTLLPAAVGHHFAMEMMLTAKYYRGAELRGRGLFNHVVPAGEVRGVALDTAVRMAEKPRHVLEMVKGTLSVARRRALQEGMSREHLMHQLCFQHPDAKQLIAENYVNPPTLGAKEDRSGEG